uniref:Uncharacterized protein n=1 Tax=Anguilla anguilla TaxID=7936 RepID=A0A0E9TK51_ANGAN
MEKGLFRPGSRTVYRVQLQ